MLTIFSACCIAFHINFFSFSSAQQAQSNAAAAAIHASITLKGPDDHSRHHNEEIAMNHNYESEYKPSQQQQQEYELAGY